MPNIFQKFSTHSKKAIKNAFALALNLGHRAIHPYHILYGLSQQRGSVGAEILAKAKIDGLKIKQAVSQVMATHSKITQISFDANSKRLLEKAVLLASLNKHKYIGTEHLLAAAIEINDEKIIDLFWQNNVDIAEIKKQTETALNSSSKFSDLTGALGDYNEDEIFTKNDVGFNQPKVLDFFAVNLTDNQIQKNIDPVIGREHEIDRLIQILSRRHKNNPILLGDPGVGKTAIVEGLAKKILHGEVPPVLSGKKIYTLDLSSVVAGTSFRGEFENRIRQIILEIKKDPDIILFIDEIHNLTRWMRLIFSNQP